MDALIFNLLIYIYKICQMHVIAVPKLRHSTLFEVEMSTVVVSLDGKVLLYRASLWYKTRLFLGCWSLN